jgi:GMP synthase (glutamine-hydrolysing)
VAGAWVVLQHVPFEGPGLIAPAAAESGLALEVRRLDRADPVPRPSEVGDLGGVVVMGGPMGALDDADHPHLAPERSLLAAAVTAGVPVLGVCLGAQLLAAACHAPVFPGSAGAEIGLGTVELSEDGRADAVLGPAGRVLPVLHWHGDTFELPAGAVRLASTARYPNQAFRLGKRAYGLQFHVEVDEAAATAMEPQLPGDVPLDRRHLALVRRAGLPLLRRFFATVA